MVGFFKDSSGFYKHGETLQTSPLPLGYGASQIFHYQFSIGQFLKISDCQITSE
jgi:hypothetical protein